MSWWWWEALHRWRRRRVLARRAIPDDLWARNQQRFPFLAQPLPEDEARLRELTSLFLDAKQFSGAKGFQVTDEVAIAVASQACLPVLNLGLSWYDGFVDIVIHGGELTTRRRHMDDDGVVHEFDDVFAGEAMAEGGPITLSWQDVCMAGASGEWAYSVVIHEMAHVLDMRNGLLDGAPALGSSMAHARWQSILSSAFGQLCSQVDADQPTAMDPYGSDSPDEFFAVACESFFVTPGWMQEAYPALYGELQGFFQQDPASHA